MATSDTNPVPEPPESRGPFTRRRRLQLFAVLAVIALIATVFGQHEVAIGLVVFGLIIIPSDWFPRG